VSQRAEAIAREATSVLARLQASGIDQPAVGVVVNRVARARGVFERLRTELKDSARVIMLIGPARAVDRDEVAKELAPIRTGHPEPPRQLRETLIVVATQTIEAGVDIDLDGLVTEAAALDALRQRFGRLNRAGRSIVPEAVVVALEEDLGAKADAVYEDRIKKTWEALKGLTSRAGAIDFGVQVLRDRIGENAAELAAPVKDAPILMPAYADLWSQTSPIPNADAEAALFLHGPDRSPAAVQIVWRADVHEQDDLRPAMGNEAERARIPSQISR
jgi:CRISPR-associated endonuclease/helicase Cas3